MIRPDLLVGRPTPLGVASRRRLLAGLAVLGLAGCGGGSALDNSTTITNGPGSGGQVLSFVYFQRCIDPVLITPIVATINGNTVTNTCAAGGCHDNTTGTGGALRLIGSAPAVDPTLGSAAIRATDMYKNFYSAFGEAAVGQPDQSRLIDKPLVLGVLHGGGQIFATPTDPRVQLMRYWISHPMPQGQDEFSSAASALFANGDPVAGACLSQ